MNKIFLILISLFSLTIEAQSDSINQSIIRISERDLNAIISRIVEAKKSVYNIRNITTNQPVNTDYLAVNFEIDNLNKKIDSLASVLYIQNSKNAISSKPSNENLLLKYKLEALQYKIDDMNRLLDNQKTSEASKIIIKHEPILNQLPAEDSNEKAVEEYKQMLQSKLDSIYLQLKNNQSQKPSLISTNTKSINNKLDSIQKEKTPRKATPSNYMLLSKKYSEFKAQLFFENNSIVIDNQQTDSLNGIVSILKAHDNIDVLLKGFASKKGSPLYNQNLSMQRTEAVKKILVSKGIHPTRILSMHYGIDYVATTDIEARRVDMSLIIRK